MSLYHVLACVTGQKSCEKLIVEGARIAKEMDGELSVLHVATKTGSMLGYPVEGDAIEYLYQISSENDADMTVMRAADVVEAIADFVKKKGANIVLMGAGKRGGRSEVQYQLAALLPDVILQTAQTYED